MLISFCIYNIHLFCGFVGIVHNPFLQTSPSVKTPFVSHITLFAESIHPALLPNKSKPSTNGLHTPDIHTDLKIELVRKYYQIANKLKLKYDL